MNYKHYEINKCARITKVRMGRICLPHFFSFGKAISASLQKSLDSMKTDNWLGSEIGANLFYFNWFVFFYPSMHWQAFCLWNINTEFPSWTTTRYLDQLPEFSAITMWLEILGVEWLHLELAQFEKYCLKRDRPLRRIYSD